MYNYTIIQNELINTTTTDLSNGAFRLLILMQSMCYAEKIQIFPSQRYLGERLKCSVRTIQRYLKELEGKYITKKRRGSTSNIYTVLTKVKQNIHSKAQQIVNSAKETFNKNKANNNSLRFTQYAQREYDPDLENKLRGSFGWHEEKDRDGSPYDQLTIT